MAAALGWSETVAAGWLVLVAGWWGSLMMVAGWRGAAARERERLRRCRWEGEVASMIMGEEGGKLSEKGRRRVSEWRARMIFSHYKIDFSKPFNHNHWFHFFHMSHIHVLKWGKLSNDKWRKDALHITTLLQGLIQENNIWFIRTNEVF